MADNEADESFQNLTKLITLAEKGLSESDTRAKIIDPLFKDCLGWTEKDIQREPYVNPGYLDYLFSIDGIKKFALEAKKTGSHFHIPKSLKRRSYRIDATITTDKNIKKAIEQAQRYCVDSGVRYGVVSNGHQFILFEAFRYGKPWRSTSCMVFRSLEDIKKNFTLFWNILSKDSVLSGSFKEYISRDQPKLKYERPLEKFRDKDSKLIRNYLSREVQPIINHIFQDIIDESQRDILKRCYVVDQQFTATSSSIRSQFDRLPHYAEKFNIKQLFQSEVDAGEFETDFAKCEGFLRDEVPRGSLILLLGGIGSGKTTFIHRFFKFVLEKRPKALWFYVDFKESFPDPERIETYIYNGIVKDYQARYHDTLKKRLENAGISDPMKPNRKDILVLFSMLTYMGFTISLVLDNVDQHYLRIPEFQERVFLVAQSLTKEFKTITILTLREESFHKSIKSGVLNAYNFPMHHISSPNVEALIKRRIDYTLQLLAKSDEEITEVLQSPFFFGAKKDMIKAFFEIIRYSLRHTRKVGRDILQFLSDVSGGNMREVLRFLNMFITSGNTNLNEMLYIKDRFGNYVVPFHHVIKSIMLGDSKHYSSSRSDVMNVFDLNPNYTNSHFLNLRILEYLNGRVSYSSTLGKGFVEIDTILSESERVSINQKAVEDSLKRLAYFGLVEFDNQSKEGYDTATHVKIRNTGTYYLQHLIHRFVYLDLVSKDTPLSDGNTVSRLGKLIGNPDLEDRFAKTDVFLDYLQSREEEEFTNNPEYRDSDLTKVRYMDRIIEMYKEEKRYIRSKRQRKVTVNEFPEKNTFSSN